MHPWRGLCRGQGLRGLPTGGDGAVEVEHEVAQADLIEAAEDRVDRRPLLGDEEDPLAPALELVLGEQPVTAAATITASPAAYNGTRATLTCIKTSEA